MRIVFISSWYSEGMGYAENMLPRTMASLGHEVHLVAANVQVYFNSADYKKTYEKLLGPAVVETGSKTIDGYTLHRLPHTLIGNKIIITGLQEYLIKLNPDIIQTFEIDEPPTYDAAVVSGKIKCRLFTESHMHKSVFLQSKKKKIRSWVARILPTNRRLRLINKQTILCYPIAEDVADLASEYFKVPVSKIKIQSLGVDTNLFRLPDAGELQWREIVRKQFEFKPEDIVCIYTGRFAKDKDPHTLARAINAFAQNENRFKGLFVGNGTAEDIEYIKSMNNCFVQPFVSVNELNRYYWASDIGVWPRQESTSQLDAAACGLPLVLSDKIHVSERVNGNGFLYKEGDSEDLVLRLLQLKDKETRKKLGCFANKKVLEHYSWMTIAEQRIADYKLSLTTNAC
jgi:glycosyltransferase involved in cell wall biosynthesis